MKWNSLTRSRALLPSVATFLVSLLLLLIDALVVFWLAGGIYRLLPRLKERRRQLGGSLSGGEQQMCAIGRGLMACPDILVLDEPSLGLAPIVVRDIFALLAKLRNEGLSILLVEQHVTHALALADQAFVLQNGRIAMSGPGPELLRNPALKRAYMGQKH